MSDAELAHVDRHSRVQRGGVDRRGRPRSRVGAARGARSSSSTTARPTTPATAAAAAGARVDPPSVQQRQRRGRQDRHPPGGRRVRPDHRRRRPASAADAARLVAHLDDYDLVVGARSRRHAGQPRRGGSATRLLNALASYLTEQPIPDLTSGFRAARRDCLLEFIHLLPNGFSTPTTTTLAFIKAGYSVPLRTDRGGAARGGRRKSASAPTASTSC